MSVHAWGTGKNGELGLGNTETTKLDPTVIEGLGGKNIIEVACGEQHTLVLSEFGDVYSWGRGRDGQLGTENIIHFSATPIKIKNLASETIVGIACGYYHCLAITEQGQVYEWGQLHSATSDIKYFGATIGLAGLSDEKKEMIDRSMRRYYAGKTQGQDQHITNFGSFQAFIQRIPKLVEGIDNVRIKSVAAGYAFSIAISDVGKTFAWGFNDKYQLGLGHRYNQANPQPVTDLIDVKIIQADCGQQHTLALADNGHVYSWGLGVFGQLGHGFLHDCAKPQRITEFDNVINKVIQVACGSHHSIGLTEIGTVFTWGSSEYGQLGGKDSNAADWQAGDHQVGRRSKEQTYFFSIPRILDAFDGKTVKRVCCGHLHNIAVTDHGEVYTWGWGINGALGHGNRKFRLKPSLLQRMRGQNIVRVGAGSTFSIAVTGGGSSTFAFDFKSLVNNPLYSDIKFKIHGTTLYGHKAIIFPRCQYLRQMASMYRRFSLKSEADDIEIPGMDLRVFQALLYFLYTDHLKVPPHLTSKLEKTAKIYKLPRLVALCKQYNKFSESVGGHEDLSSWIPPSIFSNQMQDAVNDPYYADVEFKLVDGTIVSGHKAILTARCDFFKTVFAGVFMESDQKLIPIFEISSNLFLDLLNYIYTNLVSFDADVVVDLLMAADRFLLEDLKERIEKDLEQVRQLDNVVDLLLISEQASSPRLKRSCIDLIVQNLDAFKSTGGFSRLEKEAPLLLRQIDFISARKMKKDVGSVFKKTDVGVEKKTLEVEKKTLSETAVVEKPESVEQEEKKVLN